MSMKANELRIGNYIKLMFNYEDYELLQVTSDELVDVDKKRADYEPIPLTEEWLYKFGFKDIDKGDHDYITYTDPNHDYYLQIDVRKKDGKYSILDNSFDDLRDFSMVDISYVHQLQNLYFALTGEEIIYYLNMNKEQEQIIDEAYKNYKRFTHNKNEKNGDYGDYSKWGDNPLIAGVQHLTKDSFIQMIKIGPEFSQEWGLRIEERELSLEERGELFRKTYPGKSVDDFAPSGMEVQSIRHQLDTRYNKANIPTKLITITYNNKTIESYE